MPLQTSKQFRPALHHITLGWHKVGKTRVEARQEGFGIIQKRPHKLYRMYLNLFYSLDHIPPRRDKRNPYSTRACWKYWLHSRDCCVRHYFLCAGNTAWGLESDTVSRGQIFQLLRSCLEYYKFWKTLIMFSFYRFLHYCRTVAYSLFVLLYFMQNLIINAERFKILFIYFMIFIFPLYLIYSALTISIV